MKKALNDFLDAIYATTGELPRELQLPPKAFDALAAEQMPTHTAAGLRYSAMSLGRVGGWVRITREK